jgi:hypothetical protein
VRLARTGAAMRLTKSQTKLLKMLATENYDGWMEIYLEYGDEDGGSQFALTKLVVENVFRALKRRGLATENGDNWPILTDAGAKLQAELFKASHA